MKKQVNKRTEESAAMRRWQWRWTGSFLGGWLAATAVWLMVHGWPADPVDTALAAGEPPRLQAIGSVERTGLQPRETGMADVRQPAEALASARDDGPPAAAAAPPFARTVRVYLSESRTVERVSLEQYVRGVVAAELPLDFSPAAMEAQALAARTYIVRRLWTGDRSHVPVRGADVTDTIAHQAYRSTAEMQALRRRDPEGWDKVAAAVKATEGRVLVYKGQPIEALYFSTSNGYTEASEEVFSARIPYLRPVASPWDELAGAPRAKETIRMDRDDFYERLGVRDVAALAGEDGPPPVRITELSEGRRVRTLAVGGRTLTGKEVRERLALRSTAFSFRIGPNEVEITTLGSGHGVGMSQWGAEGMARAGRTAEEIVRHYYQGIEIIEIGKLPARNL